MTFERDDERRLAELLSELRDDARAPAGFRASVMRAIDEIPTHVSAGQRLVDWWLRPRTVHVTPAWGALAAAAVAALLLVRPGSEPAVGPSDQAAVAAAATPAVTRFVLVAPGASSVHVTGDFVSWSRDGIALEDPRGTGVWTADVALDPGVYQYTFVIDGTRWVPDPQAMSQVDDGFGQVNSVVIVPNGSEA